jgi:lysophospholipase L1-like esterase
MNLRSKSRIQLALMWGASLLLFPLLLVQGIRIRSTAQRLPVAPGPDRGSFGDDPGFSFLGLGDSVIAGVGVDSLENALTAQVARRWHMESGRAANWQAAGVNGERIAGLIAKLEANRPGRADVMLVSIGVNDVTGLTSLLKWQLQVTRLITLLEAGRPGIIVLLGVPPMEHFTALPQPLRQVLGIRAALLDLTLRQIAGLLNHVIWVDASMSFEANQLAEDGYHPNAEACVEIAAEIVNALSSASRSSI